SASGGYGSSERALMRACGKLTEPGRWPRRKSSGLRTSRRTKPPDSSEAGASQQSGSRLGRGRDGRTAVAEGAAGAAVTGERDGRVGIEALRAAKSHRCATCAPLAVLPYFVNTLPMATSHRSVAVLAYDGLCTFEFALAVEVFGLRRPELGVPWYD